MSGLVKQGFIRRGLRPSSLYDNFCLCQQTGEKLPALVVVLCLLAVAVTDLKIIQLSLFD